MSDGSHLYEDSVSPGAGPKATLESDHSNALAALENNQQRASEAAAKIKSHTRKSVAAAVSIGLELLQIKGILPHGEFLNWVTNEAGLLRRTSSSYMAIARCLGDKWEKFSHLDLGTADLLARKSTPEHLRQAIFKEVEDGRTLTCEQIREWLGGPKAGKENQRGETTGAAAKHQLLPRQDKKSGPEFTDDAGIEISDLLLKLLSAMMESPASADEIVKWLTWDRLQFAELDVCLVILEQVTSELRSRVRKAAH